MKKNLAIIENNILATNTIRYKLTKVLVEKGYNVYVLTTGTPKELQQARDNGFNIIDVKSSTKNPADILQYMKNITKALKLINADACLTFTIRPAIWGNIVTRRLSIPTITNITGIGPLFASDSIVYRSARTMYKFVLKKTAKLFFQNNDDMKLFIDNNFIKPELAERIPGSGIDHEYFRPMEPPIEKKGISFLFISRLVKDKGIGEYVEAARLLKKVLPGATFQVLGPMWLQNLKGNTVTRQELDGWLKEDIITYLGEAMDVRPYIAAADCIVLPSYREGTSNVLLEASAMERPCITCDVTGCREIVDDGITGFLCAVKNAGDLAASMKKMALLPMEKRMDMGKKARIKVIREFDKQIVIDAYLNALEKL
jgi:glycosyltransferase involved in cell wall biosynthesis